MYEMTIRLQTGGNVRLYEQIYEHIKTEIRKGKLLAGERLPSTRFLADYLQVARSTVDSAYSQLQAEGYIEAEPCRGYFVCSVEELAGLGELDGPETATGRAAAGENSWTEKGKSAFEDVETGIAMEEGRFFGRTHPVGFFTV